MQKNNLAIILSGGLGNRFDSKVPKQFFKINNMTIIEESVEKFISSNRFNQIIIVSHKDYLKKTKDLLKNDKLKIISGGKSRQESVFFGLKEAKKFNPDNVIIHDSVRPLFSKDLIDVILNGLKSYNGIIPSMNANDSVRIYKKGVFDDIPRTNLKLIQTPQGFEFNSIFNAHQKLKNKTFTDDSIMLYQFDRKIKIINGEKLNFKITTKDDLELAKIIERKTNMNNIRVGNGFDVHKFKKGDKLTIFGVKIPFNKSLSGHSDADVGFHSIVDAILGALCKGDIGNHFSPDDNKWKDKDSIIFMKFAKKLLIEENFKINNLDITLICEKPKVSKYKKLFLESVCKSLEVDKSLVNIKGTTTEKLGFLGREEGIACQVSVTISKNEK